MANYKLSLINESIIECLAQESVMNTSYNYADFIGMNIIDSSIDDESQDEDSSRQQLPDNVNDNVNQNKPIHMSDSISDDHRPE